MKLREIISLFERFAPLNYQESYDNAGLQVGDYGMEVSGALVCLDVTEEVLDEAMQHDLNLVVAHHPVIFGGLKSVCGKNMVERIVAKAIKNDIAIYAAHTNMDAMPEGVSGRMAEKLGLSETRILDPMQGKLSKLVVFVPQAQAEKVRLAMFESGAGKIGNYDSCSFNAEGLGSFRAGEDTKPFVGEKGSLHMEKEVRIETVFPEHVKGRVITAMLQAHPYEEVAYDLYALENKYSQVGMGMIGKLQEPMDEEAFMLMLKKTFGTGVIKHSGYLGKKIKKVALCGGAGSSLLRKAIAEKADIFVSGDFKYHQFFEAEEKIVIADIGHFESEQYTQEIFYEILTKNLPKFAVRITELNTNPIKYFN